MEQVNYGELKNMVRLFVAGSDMPSPWFPMEYVTKHMEDVRAMGASITLIEQGNYKRGIDRLLYCIEKGTYVEVEINGAREHVYYLDGSWYIGSQQTEELWVRLAIQNHYMENESEWVEDITYIDIMYIGKQGKG